MAEKTTYQRAADARRASEGGTKTIGPEAGVEDRVSDAAAREKYDPSARSKPKTQAEVEASGGLGALAAKQKAERQKKAMEQLGPSKK